MPPGSGPRRVAPPRAPRTSFAQLLARHVHVVMHTAGLRLARWLLPAWLFYYGALRNLRLLLAALTRRSVQRRLVSFAVLFNLLLWPGHVLLARDFSTLAGEAAKGALSMVGKHFSSQAYAVKRLFSPAATPPQDTTETRTARVSVIHISPAKIVARQNQSISFSAVGSDALGHTVQGPSFSWSSSDPAKVRIDDTGQATPLAPGLAWITATTPSVSSRAPVLVLPGVRQLQTDIQWQAEQDLLREDGTTAGSIGGVGDVLASLVDKVFPTAYAQTGGSGDFAYDELWSEPRNLVGSPRNRAVESTVIGSVLPEGSNLEFSIPIWNPPGRGLPVGVALNYNSRIWSRHGSAVTFNAVDSWPYLGFTVGFGRIVTYGSDPNTKLMLVEGDGTRHYLGSGLSYQTGTYQTSDGSHITYVGTATTGGTLYFNSGVQMTVGVVNNRLLVTQIKDPNGNYISISYAGGQPPPGCYTTGASVKQTLSSISDTLGRVIQFNNDCLNLLTSITVPGFNGTSQTIAQFDYSFVAPSTSFTGLTVENVGTVPALSHVYYPATQTGYKFSYSAYGMIYNVSLRKQMTVNLDGSINDGTETAYMNFNYPTVASSLTDAPSFTQRTESPGGIYAYSTTTGAQTLIFTVARPDSSTLNLTRSTDVTSVANGLLAQSEIKNSGGASMAKSVLGYVNDPGGQPQVQSVTSYDDTGTPTKVDFDYDGYGNVVNRREYGFQVGGLWQVRRRRRSVYKTDAAYINAYLRSVVIESDVYDAQLNTTDADDILIAKSTYTIDDYTALGGMENYGGTANPPGHDSTYDITKTVRGNVTGRTEYSDVVAGTSTTWLNKIDIFGGVTKTQVACCNQQSATLTDTNGYSGAQPASVTKGDPSVTSLTTSFAYDFNTSARTSTTDPNSQQTSYGYDAASLRPTSVTAPTGASKTVSYNDTQQQVSATVSFSEGSSTSTKTYDGFGRTITEVSAGGQVNTTYDAMGRVASRTNPFTPGGTPGPATSYSYDALGRVTVVTLPDGNTVQTSYSGSTVTVTDQVLC